ncbi:hypothetical protein VNO77_07094 [Canavalia gladiata]|uniref:Cytochrome P450 n=1 Tax=Canavalia gladiata TaxID=3824 RepID=A0AAN9M7A9_CANGL
MTTTCFQWHGCHLQHNGGPLGEFVLPKCSLLNNLIIHKFFEKKKVKELMDYVEKRCKKGEALDIGKASFTTVLNSISNTLFSMDLGHYTSAKSQEFKDIIWAIMEEAGRPNVVDFFPIFRFLDPLGARARMNSYFGKLIAFFDSLVEEILRLRGSENESKACNDVLDSVLELMLEDNSQVTRSHVLHLFLVSISARSSI